MGRIFQLQIKIKNILCRIRGIILKYYLIINGCQVGSKLRCHRFPVFRVPPRGNLSLGDNVTIGYHITFDIVEKAHVYLGTNVKLTQNILIGCQSNISIGPYTMIAENCTIRDSNHDTYLGQKISLQQSTSAPINIGEDVWIGAGTIVLSGSFIPDGAVIGANSVVLATSKLEDHSIYAGAPVRFIRKRGTK